MMLRYYFLGGGGAGMTYDEEEQRIFSVEQTGSSVDEGAGRVTSSQSLFKGSSGNVEAYRASPR